ncbi:hypothetical protein C5Y96_17210 [Blastopirellula marina]|uniref:Uncharacterized protein n=1 Tax=Blastopirellula marina TaxID=124 RepID=A0A2S8F546_9BACT|nr:MULTISPECIES: hypothetical protein [Pirellulaceae]PQO27283.1 hypothetical protein C5Y96_17210 [Blastopirellula marina]RCS47820.1 hypothetical protein DTL36_17235 [Bremerella cremea]
MPVESEVDGSGKQWSVEHHCVLCEIIAVLHQGTLLIDSPATSTEVFCGQFYLGEASQQNWRHLGVPAPRGPPIS